MKNLRISLLAMLLPALGCCAPRAHTGWRFEVLRPPTVTSESLVQSSGHTLGLLGQCSGGLRGELAGLRSLGGSYGPFEIDQAEAERSAIFAALERIHLRLDSIERQTAPTLPPAKSSRPIDKNHALVR